MIEFLEYFPVVLALGSYFVDELIYNGISNLSLIMIIVSSVNFIFPTGAVNRYIFPLDNLELETKSYAEARTGFLLDYDLVNPITKEKAREEWL